MDNRVNGVGPSWFPKKLRTVLTKFSLLFFEDYCWSNHDIGYSKGGTIYNKIQIDFLFFKQLNGSLRNKNLFKKIVGHLLSTVYFLAVLSFGLISFNFKKKG